MSWMKQSQKNLLHRLPSNFSLRCSIALVPTSREKAPSSLRFFFGTENKPTACRPSHRSSLVESFKVMDVLQRANILEKQQSDEKPLLHCEVGQPETGAPRNVVARAVELLTQKPQPPVLGYTNAFGLTELRERIAQHYRERYSVDTINIDRIVITTGSSAAFLLTFTACFDAGDVVAVASAGYPCYRNILSALGCPDVASIPVNAHFKVTAAELRSAIAERRQAKLPRIRGLILSSPSNPTGAMLTPTEIEDLCDLCRQEDITFLSDEIYHGISYGTRKDEATALQYSNDLVVINSFSKYYSMPGWRLGWMIVPDSLVPAINKLQQNMFINAPTISQQAALACWDPETIEELEAHVRKYKTSRSVILEGLSAIGDLDQRGIAPADGGFYIYVDVGEQNIAPGLGSVAMCKAFLEEEYVALTPGIDFEDPATKLGDRRFRISYAGGIDTSEKAMERFRRFWPSWIQRVRRGQST